MDPRRSEDIQHRMLSRSEAIKRVMFPQRCSDKGVRAEQGRVSKMDPWRSPDNGVRAELGKGAHQ